MLNTQDRVEVLDLQIQIFLGPWSNSREQHGRKLHNRLLQGQFEKNQGTTAQKKIVYF